MSKYKLILNIIVLHGAGTYIVTASEGSFNGTGSAVVIVDEANVEIDFISGNAAGIVDFGLETGSGLPKVSITATDSSAAEKNLDPATFTVTRTGSTDESMTVNFNVSGTAQTSIDYNTLAESVVIPVGQSSAVITVTPFDDDEIEGQETVVLSLLASLDYQFGETTSDTATIADDEGILVSFGDGIAKSVSFTESDNTSGTISLISATGTIIFVGEGLTIEQGKSSVVVSGYATITDIDITSSSTSASLGFKATGGDDGLISVENITINGSAKDIKGKQVNLTGDLTVTGGLTKLELNNVADQHLISVGPPDSETNSLTINLNQVANLSIDSESAIKSLTAVNWQDNDATQDMITATRLDKLTVSENFPGSIVLTDSSAKFTLGTVKAGAITGGTWDITGHGSKITANSISGNWSATYSGDLAGLSVTQDISGSLTARSVKAVSVKGNYTNGNLTLTQLSTDPKAKALGKITVNGTMNNVDIRSQGNIGGVTVGLLFDSNIFAGINDLITALPSSSKDFDTDVAIAKLMLKGSKTENIWMQNSNIAAANINSVSFGFAETDNSGYSFGIATKQFKSIGYVDATSKIKAGTLDDLAKFNNLDDLLIRII
ncbi:MAG: hypothetical protein JW860_10035 [Sedimentisphaerales bacterium]|nr:hypothetical protein [Sedimentisphaerales bacterium]